MDAAALFGATIRTRASTMCCINRRAGWVASNVAACRATTALAAARGGGARRRNILILLDSDPNRSDGTLWCTERPVGVS